MNLGFKIKAGALQFVLFIGAVIAVLLLSFLLITHTHSFFSKKTDRTIEVIQAADFGIKYAFQKPLLAGRVLDVSSEQHDDIVIQVKKEYWGVFEKYTSEASFKKIHFSKTALVGVHSFDGLPALYLADKKRPLIVAGTTKITGNAFLPEQGIRMGNISGNSYRYGNLLYGRKSKSKATLPKLNPELVQQLSYLEKGGIAAGASVFLKPKMQIKNSFEEPTIRIQDDVIRLKDVAIRGNIVIRATRKITVERTAFLKDVLLIAPVIHIEDKVSGTFQAIAKETIQVGKHCELAYPSALVVIDEKKSEEVLNRKTPPKIFIDKNSVVKGAVCYLNEDEKQAYNPQIKLAEQALVQGEVYCTKNLELKGAVMGNVNTNGFIALENGSIYQNHIYNGTINSTALPLEYVGMGIVRNDQRKKVMKWLY